MHLSFYFLVPNFFFLSALNHFYFLLFFSVKYYIWIPYSRHLFMVEYNIALQQSIWYSITLHHWNIKRLSWLGQYPCPWYNHYLFIFLVWWNNFFVHFHDSKCLFLLGHRFCLLTVNRLCFNNIYLIMRKLNLTWYRLLPICKPYVPFHPCTVRDGKINSVYYHFIWFTFSYLMICSISFGSPLLSASFTCISGSFLLFLIYFISVVRYYFYK